MDASEPGSHEINSVPAFARATAKSRTCTDAMCRV
jgi:hypothetical protein